MTSSLFPFFEKSTPKSCVCFGIALDFATNNKTSWKSLEKGVLEKLHSDNITRGNYFLFYRHAETYMII